MPGTLQGPSFLAPRFARPGDVVFDDTYLSDAVFHNCDVSQIWFTSSVRWGRGGRRKVMVAEETMALDVETESGFVARNGRRDYRAVAQIYQQLKKSYDARLDYWTANEFHFGEMEMQRLAAPTNGRLLKLRHWWHTHLSLVALYRWGSDYGNSYAKPVWWIGALLLLFALLFPGFGLEHSNPKYTETYGRYGCGRGVVQDMRCDMSSG